MSVRSRLASLERELPRVRVLRQKRQQQAAAEAAKPDAIAKLDGLSGAEIVALIEELEGSKKCPELEAFRAMIDAGPPADPIGRTSEPDSGRSEAAAPDNSYDRIRRKMNQRPKSHAEELVELRRQEVS